MNSNNRITPSIVVDDLSDPRIAEFLEDHLREMRSVSPPESKHALDIASLKKPGISFWSVWANEELVGCGALKRLDATHAEIKSMRVSGQARGQGIASRLLKHMIEEAKTMGIDKLSLETGSMAFFEPAHKLYKKYGFQICGPFGSYKEDPNTLFMSLNLANRCE